MEHKNSTWNGGVLETLLHVIGASLIMSITCGIATPWAICYMMKFFRITTNYTKNSSFSCYTGRRTYNPKKD